MSRVSDNPTIYFLDAENAAFSCQLDQESYLISFDPAAAGALPISPDRLRAIQAGFVRLFCRDGLWFIEALETENLYINGHRISAYLLPCQVTSGDVLQIGNSRCVLLMDGAITSGNQQLMMIVSGHRVVNLTTALSETALIRQLIIVSRHDTALENLRLMVTAEDIALEETIDVRRIEANSLFCVDPFLVPRISDALFLQQESISSTIHIELIDRATQTSVLTVELPLEVTAATNWPYARAYQSLLASYVTPHHPFIDEMVVKAKFHLSKTDEAPESLFQLLSGDNPARFEETFLCLYHYLLNEYKLTFSPPAQPNSSLQKIRMAENLIIEQAAKGKPGMGTGSCLDLALLLAGCLENLQLNPLIAIIEDDDHYWHALVGMWTSNEKHFQPLYRTKMSLMEGVESDRLILLDPNCLTEYYGKPEAFSVARERAEAFLRERPLIFALDVQAARDQGVVPMQFAFGGMALQALRLSRQIASSRKSAQLKSWHLLLALIRDSHKVRKTFIACGGNINTLNRLPEFREEAERISYKTVPDPAGEYREVLARAWQAVFADGRRLVDDIDLVRAVLLDRETSASDFLAKMNVPFDVFENAFHEQRDDSAPPVDASLSIVRSIRKQSTIPPE